MTYEELEINTEINLREKSERERVSRRTVKYTIVAKYPRMCIVEDKKGRRRGVAIGELIVNKVINQDPFFESLRKEGGGTKMSRGWHKKDAQCTAEYAP